MRNTSSVARGFVALAVSVTLTSAPATRAAAAGFEQVHLRGLLDLVMAGRGDAHDLNAFNDGGTNFDAYHLRLFAEAQVADQVQVYTQLMVEEDEGAALYGAYAMYTPRASRDMHVIAGKIPWRIGTYAERSYSNHNPLVGTPLMYQYHTTLRADRLPPNGDALANAAGTGQYGPVYDASGSGWRGMPIVYDNCWDFGVMLTGSERPVEYSLGVVNGSPSSPNPGEDGNAGKTWLGRVGVQAWPGVRVGGSVAYGPYLNDRFNEQLAPGQTVNGFAQKVLMADAEWLVSDLELRAEGIHNTWQTPTVGDLDLDGGYVEARVRLPQGAYAAGRWGALKFGDVVDSTGATRPWDQDLTRLELGLGYRLQKDVTLKGVYQRTTFIAGKNERESLYAVQASVAF